jgi:hypothetical protein
VNKLFRQDLPTGIEGQCLAKSLCAGTEVVGGVLFEPGDVKWVLWTAVHAMPGQFEILKFDRGLVDSVRKCGMPKSPDDIPGFVCMDCWDKGKFAVFATRMALIGHVGGQNYRPNDKLRAEEARKAEEAARLAADPMEGMEFVGYRYAHGRRTEVWRKKKEGA